MGLRQTAIAVSFLLALSGYGQSQPQSAPEAPAPHNASQEQSQPGQDNLNSLAAHVRPGGASSSSNPPGTGQVPQAGPAQQKPPIIAPPGELQENLPTFRQNVNFVVVPVLVLDRNHREVAGVTWRDFEIYEDGARQQIAFFSEDPLPLSVALVIDQGVPEDVMKKVNDSLNAIPFAFTVADEVSLFVYGDSVRKITDFTSAQSARLPAALQQGKTRGADRQVPINQGPLYEGPQVNDEPVDPNTETQRSSVGVGVLPKDIHPLNDAILTAAQELATRPKERRRIVYVISDGKESRSKTPLSDVIRYLQTYEISVFGTLVGDSAIWGLGTLDKFKLPLLPLPAGDILPKYADATGGVLSADFSENAIQKSFLDLAVLARNEYTLGYYSHAPLLDEKFRSLEVRVLHPDLTLLAPKGFYPALADLHTPPHH